MKLLCRSRWSLLSFALLLCTAAATAQSTDDLPSAPSATNQPKPAAKPSGPQAPASPAQGTPAEGQARDRQPAIGPASSPGSDSSESNAADAGSSDVIDEGGVTI